MAVHCLVFLGFLTISTLPVRWCQAVALAFLHLSLGRQKATSGSFSTDGFGWLGLNPAGVSLFRMHVERCPSGPLSCIQPRPKLLFHGRPLPGFPWFFNTFDASKPSQKHAKPCSGRGWNGSFRGSFGLGWIELENMEWTRHAKQGNPSRIQANHPTPSVEKLPDVAFWLPIDEERPTQLPDITWQAASKLLKWHHLTGSVESV